MPNLVDSAKLTKFCEAVFAKLGVCEEDARVTTDVLVTADLRGIDSHGTARLGRYVAGLEAGTIRAEKKLEVISETPAIAAINAHDGLGQVAGAHAMELAIEKAKAIGIGVATVKHSNHYGIAGWYALAAAEQDLIGISLTNANPLVVPTFGREALFGTNPLAIACPAGGDEIPFLLDMATSTVPRGKLEVYNRAEKDLPRGWAVDPSGQTATEPGVVLDGLVQRTGGGLTPLGGVGELFSGHKGYGLALAVDILSGVLSGAAYSTYVGQDGAVPANIGHFFLAIDISKFEDLDRFKNRMKKYKHFIKESAKAEGTDEIYIHGEKSHARKEEREKSGIPMQEKAFKNLAAIGEKFGVEFEIEKN